MDSWSGLLPIPAMFVAILFAYSGIGKLQARDAFIRSLLLIPFLPHRFSRVAGLAIPSIEILIGVFLFWNVAAAKIAAIALLSLFALVALLAVSRNQRVPCNCFGTDGSEFLSKLTVVRNIALAVLLVPSLSMPASRPGLLAANYAVVAFVLFLSVLKATSNLRQYQQLDHGTRQ